MLASETENCNFFLPGIRVQCTGPGSAFLAEDFSAFSGFAFPHPPHAALKLQLVGTAPSAEDLPNAPAEQVYPECVAYRDPQNPHRRLLDYHGKALLTAEDLGAECRAVLQCADASLREELAYLFLQSRVGARLDAERLHRVHALGFAVQEKAALVFLPSGGGKSTLAVSLLQQGVTLLSDDSPLVAEDASLYPYPARLAFREDFPLPAAWEKLTRPFQRRKFGAKKLLGLATLRNAGLPEALPSWKAYRPEILVLGKRHGSLESPRLELCPKRYVLKELIAGMVVGLGLPQVVELVLEHGFWSVLGMAPLFFRRFLAALKLVSRSHCFILWMSMNAEKNADLLLSELKRQR